MAKRTERPSKKDRPNGSTDERASKSDDADDGEEQNPLAMIPLPEWIVAALGALLVIGVIGFMVYQAVAGDTSPPNISIQAGAIQESQNGFLVAMTVMNMGGQTAGGVVIEGELMDGDEAVETSQATLTYVPAQSQRAGGLFFTKDPRKYELRLRALGYETP